LLTNDDGIDSPALPALARSLGGLAPVRVVAPDRERSWISKAITRHDPIQVTEVERGGITIHAASGLPADCAQLGIHELFDGPPALVVSGINIGFNYGSAFLMTSGTVGAAAEAWISGVPALAFSTGPTTSFRPWADWCRTQEAASMWTRLADVATGIVAATLEHGIGDGADILSVNLPADAGPETPVAAARLARVGYQGLFHRNADGTFSHSFRGLAVDDSGSDGTDVAIAQSGRIAVTPVVFSRTGHLPEGLRVALTER